jgi:hypothetical protein
MKAPKKGYENTKKNRVAGELDWCYRNNVVL